MIKGSIAVVSGKGGAGKTMLSMAITHELAIRSRTLILDLDIFNRGLSGLLKTGKKIADVPTPAFMLPQPVPPGEISGWTLIEAARNVVTLVYPDVDRAQRQVMEALPMAELCALLSSFIEELMERSGCTMVLLDCHGGPDILSFAAVSICARTILVSEPDRITFFGTLHFLRRMAEDCPNPSPDVRLVFNKVMPAFSERYLRRFYNQHVKELFGGRELLAVIPFEAYLSKEFERSPFVTAVFPYSQLANKARQIVLSLEVDDRRRPRSIPERLAAFLPQVTAGGAALVPRLLDLNLVTTITAIALLLFVGFMLLSDRYGSRLDQFSTHMQALILIAGLWFAQALLLNWINTLDRVFTRQFRLRNLAFAIPVWLLLTVVGMALVYVPVLWIELKSDTAPHNAHWTTLAGYYLLPSTEHGQFPFLGIYLLGGVVLWAAANLAIRTIIALWHDRRWTEGVLRVVAASLVLASLSLPMLVNKWNEEQDERALKAAKAAPKSMTPHLLSLYDDGGVLVLKNGDMVRVSLRSDTRTGRTWSVAPTSTPLLAVEFEQQAATPVDRTPYAFQTFLFRATGTGTGVLRLQYKEPGERHAADAPNFVQYVTIQPAQ